MLALICRGFSCRLYGADVIQALGSFNFTALTAVHAPGMLVHATDEKESEADYEDTKTLALTESLQE